MGLNLGGGAESVGGGVKSAGGGAGTSPRGFRPMRPVPLIPHLRYYHFGYGFVNNSSVVVTV